MTIKAIETQYKGYRFRSRLEARWAVFFDALGLAWEYEPEGFELGGGVRYLPDFRVTHPSGHATWYEVKPREWGDDGKFQKFKARLQDTDSDSESAVLLRGDPIDVLGGGGLDILPSGFSACPRCGRIDKHLVFDTGQGVSLMCYPCDWDTPIGGGHPDEPGLLCTVRPHKGWVDYSYQANLRARVIVLKAARQARAARFEFADRRVAA